MIAARAAVVVAFLALAFHPRAALAQCTTEPTDGSLVISRCEEMQSSRITLGGSGVDGAMLLRFPVVSAATWWVSRHPTRTISARNPLRVTGRETLRADAVRRRSGF